MTASRWTARHWIALLVLAALSAFLQFTNVRETEQGGIVHGDAVKYVFYAYNIKHHDTFSRVQSFDGKPVEVAPDKLTLPGYPWFVSKFLGDGAPDKAFLVRIESAQALLGVATALLAFLVALRLAPLGWAFAAGLLVATQPHLVVISDYLLTETLFTPLLLAFVLAALHAAAPNGKKWQAAIAGVLLGLACLVRPQLQVFPWMVLLAVIFVPTLRPRLYQAVIACALFGAVVLPWQLRNAHVPLPPGEPDLLVSTVYHGSFPNFMYNDDPRTVGYPYRFDPDAAAHSRNLPAAIAHVGDLFAAQPGRYVHWYLIGKPGLFLSWGHIAGVGDIFIYPVTRSPWLDRPMFRAVRDIHFWLHWPLMLLAVGTMLFALWRPSSIVDDVDRRRSVVLVSALLATVIVLHVLGLALPRYNIPFRPLELALAMVGLRAAWVAVRGRTDLARTTAAKSSA